MMLRLAEELRIRSEIEFWDRAYEGIKAEPHDPTFYNIFDETGFFYHLVNQIKEQKILSIGGGIDSFAVYLANSGAEVYSIDVSKVACQKTKQLAAQHQLKGSLQVLNICCELLNFHNEFDLVISKGALHHINFETGLARIKESLKTGGHLIATEPACRSLILRSIQKAFPYHPQVDVTPHEIKITDHELCLLKNAFSSVELYYFELFSRPSTVYLLERLGAFGFIQTLKILDSYLLKWSSFITRLCQHVVIKAKK